MANHLFHAGIPVVVTEVLEVTVRKADYPPDHGKDKPAEDEGQSEEQQIPPPPDVHQGGENVRQEPPPAFADVQMRDVTVAALEDQSLLAALLRCSR